MLHVPPIMQHYNYYFKSVCPFNLLFWGDHLINAFLYIIYTHYVGNCANQIIDMNTL